MHWFSKFKIFQKYVSSFNNGSNFKLQIDDDSIIKEELAGKIFNIVEKREKKMKAPLRIQRLLQITFYRYRLILNEFKLVLAILMLLLRLLLHFSIPLDFNENTPPYSRFFLNKQPIFFIHKKLGHPRPYPIKIIGLT